MDKFESPQRTLSQKKILKEQAELPSTGFRSFPSP